MGSEPLARQVPREKLSASSTFAPAGEGGSGVSTLSPQYYMNYHHWNNRRVFSDEVRGSSKEGESI